MKTKRPNHTEGLSRRRNHKRSEGCTSINISVPQDVRDFLDEIAAKTIRSRSQTATILLEQVRLIMQGMAPTSPILKALNKKAIVDPLEQMDALPKSSNFGQVPSVSCPAVRCKAKKLSAS